MSTSQRVILLVVAIIIATMLLYPPFTFDMPNGTTMNMGYSWIFEPPVVGSSTSAFVNIPMLLAQWAAVLVVGGIVYLLAQQ